MKIAQKYTGHGQHKNHNRGCVQQNVIYSIGEKISCVLLILKFYFQYRYSSPPLERSPCGSQKGGL